MITAHRPAFDELGFREALLADERTMAYNAAWGGTIPFPREKWEQWYDVWLAGSGYLRYYRYLYDTETGSFVGEIAYHFDSGSDRHICDVIVMAEYRNRGYGTAGIDLLCGAAKENGVRTLYDDIAADNPSYRLFLKRGFVIERADAVAVTVKKDL